MISMFINIVFAVGSEHAALPVAKPVQQKQMACVGNACSQARPARKGLFKKWAGK